MRSFYPVVMTERLAETRDFSVTHFDFEPTFEADWYVSLKRGHHELALLDPTDEYADQFTDGARPG